VLIGNLEKCKAKDINEIALDVDKPTNNNLIKLDPLNKNNVKITSTKRSSRYIISNTDEDEELYNHFDKHSGNRKRAIKTLVNKKDVTQQFKIFEKDIKYLLKRKVKEQDFVNDIFEN